MKRNSLILTLIIVFVLLGSACSKPASKPAIYDIKNDIKKGYITSVDSKNYNTDKLDEFLKTVSEGKNASITIVKLTKEGEPIYTSLTYKDNFITYKVDNLKDESGQAQTVEKKVEKFNFYKNGDKYYINIDHKERLVFDITTKQ